MSNTAEKIALLESVINDPRTPSDEREVYQNSLSRLRAAFDIEASAAVKPRLMQPPSNGMTVAVPKSEIGSLAEEITGQIIGRVDVHRVETQNTVVIQWPDKPAETHTEGTCRGMFVTRFKEAAASKVAKAGRYNDLINTKTFYRAVAYYHGMCKFFRRMPTLAELDIKKPTAQQSAVFNIIQQQIK